MALFDETLFNLFRLDTHKTTAMNIMNLLIVLAFIGFLGMMVALAMNDKALFLTNALFLAVICMHDLMRQMKTGKK